MKRKIKPSLTETVLVEKFAMIYIELGSEDVRYRKPTRATLWHIEDEQRPTQTLCGLELHGNCVSASPALAMMATPCPDCSKIVRLWVDYFPNVKAKDRKGYIAAKIRSLMRNDFVFRSHVHKFLMDIYKEPLLHVREENHGDEEKKAASKATSTKKRKKS